LPRATPEAVNSRSRHHLQIAPECLRQPRAVGVFERGRRGQSELGADPRHDNRIAAPQEMPRHIVEVDAQAQRGQFVHQHLRAGDLAVDQHPVAVEDHQLHAPRPVRPPDSRRPPAIPPP
jgi:hypothetical protein